jgi:hypothetical protein
MTGPRSSIGSPITLMMRPSVSGPTGTAIGVAGVGHFLAAHQTFGRVHGDGAHGVLAQMLGDFEHQAALPWFWSPSAFRIAGNSPSNARRRRRP